MRRIIEKIVALYAAVYYTADYIMAVRAQALEFDKHSQARSSVGRISPALAFLYVIILSPPSIPQ